MNGRRAALTAAALAAAGLALAGCSGGAGGGASGANADCAWQLHYGGTLYVLAPGQESAKVVPHKGSPLGQGWFEGCQDGGGSEPRQTVSVYPVAGVDPGLAVITEDDVIGVTDPGHLPAPLAMPAN
ncbi:DUF6281 family protein [Actinacidiphila bryophytorum]|uniref:Lipoprotein n=2 Tax=Actinacidiphila bryophytorum TaxID=1436133 RepID=A0A9W4M9E6_9ACTN|nr:DUF6281 family protein [Actinacidiphila bryophytorum]MBM9440000.1 hypothetical protein [Actinacidiphila bryophytorum]CAG7639915.1 conserved exported hypothetical protein [Actinacidiphila bryophytorum]